MLVETAHAGGQGPTLLYVPGIDGSGHHLLGTRDRLERAFRVVSLRYRGSPSSVERGYEELASAIARHVDSPRRFLVVAESFGVAVALQLALDHPDRVRGLALVNGFARFPRPLSLAWTRCVVPWIPRGLFVRTRPWTAYRALFAPRRDPDALARLLALEGAWFDRDYRFRLAMIARLDLRERLPEIRVPVHLFASTHDRIVAARPAAEDMAARMPRARLTVVADAGHLILPLVSEPWVERLQELEREAD